MRALQDLYNGIMESVRGWRLAAVFLVLVVLLTGVWVVNRPKRVKPVQRVNEVTLTRGEVSITLNRDGAMIVRTPEGLFVQQWDEERVRAFFAQFENEDFSKFAKYKETAEGYTLTFVTEGGGRITVVLPFFDIPIPESVKQLIQVFEEVTSGKTNPTPTAAFPTGGWQPSLPATPTPTPWVRPPSYPSPTPRSRPGGAQLPPPFECPFTDPSQDITILSQTVCNPQ